MRCIRALVTSILGLSRIHLEDEVVTELEWQSETRLVPEENVLAQRIEFQYEQEECVW